jgi:hypothetical protein
MTNVELLNGAGLIVGFLGACLAASGVMISRETATRLSGTYWDENAHLKAALLKQSRTAAAGLALIAVGTALQFIALLYPA